jgi:hypothetical protein
MAVAVPGVVTPFFQPYDDAIEAQEAHLEPEPSTGPEDHPESEPAPTLS